MSDDPVAEASALFVSLRELGDHIEALVSIRFVEMSSSRSAVILNGEVADETTARHLRAVLAGIRTDVPIRNRVTVGWTGPLSPDDAWNDAMTAGDFLRAVDLAAALPPRFLVAALWWTARRFMRASRPLDAERFARRAIEVADQQLADDPERWRGRSRLLLAKIQDGHNPGEGIAAHREALALFEQAGDIVRVAETCYALSLGMLLGRVYKVPQDEVEPLFRRAIALLETLPDPDPAIWCDAHLMLASVLERRGDAEESARLRTRAEVRQ